MYKSTLQFLFVNKALMSLTGVTQGTLGAHEFPQHIKPHPSSNTSGTSSGDLGQQSREMLGCSSHCPLCQLHLGRLLLRDKVPRDVCRIPQLCPPSASVLFPNAAPNGSPRPSWSLSLIISLLCAKQLLSRNSGSPVIVKTADKKIISRILHFKKLIEGHKG